MSIATILQNIAAADGAPNIKDLRALAEIDRSDRRAFWEAWAALPDERRFDIAHTLVELSEDDVELTFNEMWYWLLDDTLAGVRASAVEGLWEDLTPRVLRRMLELLKDDQDDDVRAGVAVGLSRFAYQAALGELDSYVDEVRDVLTTIVFDSNENDEVRRRALESAGYFADDEAIQNEIAKVYDSGEQLGRESALVAMGRSMLPRWLPTIAHELGSQSPALRYEAARAAGEMEEYSQKILPRLLPLVNDSDTEVALSAIWALGQIGGETAKATLQRLRKSQDAARSQAASEALDELALGDGIM